MKLPYLKMVEKPQRTDPLNEAHIFPVGIYSNPYRIAKGPIDHSAVTSMRQYITGLLTMCALLNGCSPEATAPSSEGAFRIDGVAPEEVIVHGPFEIEGSGFSNDLHEWSILLDTANVFPFSVTNERITANATVPAGDYTVRTMRNGDTSASVGRLKVFNGPILYSLGLDTVQAGSKLTIRSNSP